MKTFLTLLVSAVALASAHPDYSDTWEEFKETYGKQYDTEEEEVRADTPWSPSLRTAGIIWLGNQQEASDTILIFYVPQNTFYRRIARALQSLFNRIFLFRA